MFSFLFFLIRYNCSWSRGRSLSEDTICGITTAFSLSTFLVLLPNFLSCTFHNYMLPLLFYRLRFIVYGPIMGLCCLYNNNTMLKKREEKKIMDNTRKFVNWLQREIDEDKILVTREKNGNLAETKRMYVPQ